MKKLNVSVIGVGHLGKIHTKLWAQNKHVNLVGVLDVNRPQARAVATEFGIRNFRTLREMMKYSDAVTIAASTKHHYSLAKKMLLNGIHCLIEKPITQTYEQGNKLIKVAEENNAIIQVGHVERFNPALRAVSSGNLKPIFIEVHRLSQFKPRAIDVSVVFDLMIHDIDLIMWMVKSKIKKISANGVAILTNTPDIANARIEFANGTIANITASRISANNIRKFRIFQKDAYISIDFGNQKVDLFKIIDGKADESNKSVALNLGSIMDIPSDKHIIYEQPKVRPWNAIQEEQNSFVESILNNKPIAVTAYEAVKAVRIAEIITKRLNSYNNRITDREDLNNISLYDNDLQGIR